MKAIVLVLSLVLACAGSIAANPANKALAKKHADQTKQAATQHSTQAAGQQATQAQAAGKQTKQAQAAGTTKTVSAKQGKAAH